MYIKLATAKEDAFAYIDTKGLQLVSHVISLACKEFPRWRLDPGQVRLHLVAESGTAEPTTADVGAALALEPLALSTRVASGAWLVVVPITPAGGSGGGGLGSDSGGGVGALRIRQRFLTQLLSHSLFSPHILHTPQSLCSPSCWSCNSVLWQSLRSARWRARCAQCKCSAGMPPSPQWSSFAWTLSPFL